MEAQPEAGNGAPVWLAYPNRAARLGVLQIARAMPIRERRMVGPWCFLDRYGPLEFSGEKPMNVPPHPHIGLQTVSWLLEGEVQHSDSLGFEALVRPGGVNVMTAGSGITHAEETPLSNSGRLHGVQLWVALPEAQRNIAPAFQHVPRVPVIETHGGSVQVFAGRLDGAASTARHYSAIVGLDLQIQPGGSMQLALDPAFEHALQVLLPDCVVEDQPLDAGMFYYLGSGRRSLSITSRAGGRLLLIGGPPFPEPILMWWNFVARSPEEIALARADWEAARQGQRNRFGSLPPQHGEMLPAPELSRLARPNPAS